MIMKLKSKDEIIIKLVEELEKHQRLSHIPQEEIDMGHLEEENERLMTLGKINIIKWILGIPEKEYTNIQL
tara:strand:- start:57 stop:269 length:213 start_codon:yes stop_codon:yes gene_type:complete